MDFKKNVSLAPLTTFGIPAKAALFAEYSSPEELLRLSRTPEFRRNFEADTLLHIGGGSNLLFAKDYPGLVLHSAIKGLKEYVKDEETVFVIAGSGVKWTDLVDWCVDHGYAGLENLAGIPGEAGASAVQNVGAYGVEAKDVIHHVECFDCFTNRTVVFKAEECRFGYRDSMFKHEWKGRYIVVRVSYRLKRSTRAEHLDYGPLKSLEEKLGHTPDIREVRDEIVAIRSAKLPDPAEIGSAGSFFKNPVVSNFFYKEQLQPMFGDMTGYPAGEHFTKLAAGWLIEHSGLKGATVGGAMVYPANCLVIVNTGNATASDVMRLAELIQVTVREKFGVNLRPEVNYIDLDIDVTVLGSGTSKGVPEVACQCRVCRSDNPHDKRGRASVLVKTRGVEFMIDASPDFREQALRENIWDLDAVLLTHSHFDHVGGIDDLRPFCATGDLRMYMRKDVDHDIRKRLDYCFRKHPYPGVPTFDMRTIGNHPFYIDGVKIIPIEVMHGKLPIFGFRIDNFAYITDAKTIEEDELEKLEGVKVLVINALRFREHFAHMSVDEALAIIEKIKPERAYLTHFNHEIGTHEELAAKLPENVFPCYDGLNIHIDGIQPDEYALMDYHFPCREDEKA